MIKHKYKHFEKLGFFGRRLVSAFYVNKTLAKRLLKLKKVSLASLLVLVAAEMAGHTANAAKNNKILLFNIRRKKRDMKL